VFKHALVQEAAYSTLLRSRRYEIHARIVAALESKFSCVADTQPELLAHHCTEAGLIAKAIRYLLKGGEWALGRQAMIEAERHLRKGLGLLSALPDESDRNRHELELQIALGAVLMGTEGYGMPAVGE